MCKSEICFQIPTYSAKENIINDINVDNSFRDDIFVIQKRVGQAITGHFHIFYSAIFLFVVMQHV